MRFVHLKRGSCAPRQPAEPWARWSNWMGRISVRKCTRFIMPSELFRASFVICEAKECG
jgi:hypothetical protein